MFITIAVDAIENFQSILRAKGEITLADALVRRGKAFGTDKIRFNLGNMNHDLLDALAAGSSEAKERSLVLQLNAYRAILNDPFAAKINNLDQLVTAIHLYLKASHIRGWVFRREVDGNLRPYLVTRVVERPANNRDQDDKVVIALQANAGSVNRKYESPSITSSSTQVTFTKDDVYKKSVAQIFSDAGLFVESADLIEAYDQDVARFNEFREKTGAQFRAQGQIYLSGDWKDRGIVEANGACLVNDERLVDRVFAENAPVHRHDDDEGEVVLGEVPTHCDLYMFHLSLHRYAWVSVNALTPYQYRPELREKIVLDEAHRDLIDVLTDDIDVVMEDIVDGKGGGTTILCRGLPGLGKTLTAEVYSEVTERPLYRVHSGQLGTTAEEVEKELTTILRRAERWKCVLLLDEADVFVRRRDNDINHNAVVAVFLRTLEYFNGLLFMTTNRLEDIDDAIISRCIAIVNYKMPEADARAQIWTIITEQFENRLDDELIADLVEAFPQVSGRDIKELTKLTFRYCAKKQIPVTVDAFRRCALFKGFN